MSGSHSIGLYYQLQLTNKTAQVHLWFAPSGPHQPTHWSWQTQLLPQTRPARTLCDVVNKNVSIFWISKFLKFASTLDTWFYHILTHSREQRWQTGPVPTFLFTGKSNKNLLTQKKDLLAASQGLLDKPIATILDLNTPSLEAWVLQAKPAIAQCRLNAEAILADFHDIAEYLQEPAPTEPKNDPDNDQTTRTRISTLITPYHMTSWASPHLHQQCSMFPPCSIYLHNLPFEWSRTTLQVSAQHKQVFVQSDA